MYIREIQIQIINYETFISNNVVLCDLRER